ncbi:zinc ribbon domain-containing protein, partial [Bordetella pertussis]|uniref:zinc ribbon domain-containing protein n=1 Tax=Bordetella pertussis TaxID=520 RepID=UPI00387A42B1
MCSSRPTRARARRPSRRSASPCGRGSRPWPPMRVSTVRGPTPAQAALAEGRLLLQHCEDCAAVRFPPALVCRACG